MNSEKHLDIANLKQEVKNYFGDMSNKSYEKTEGREDQEEVEEDALDNEQVENVGQMLNLPNQNEPTFELEFSEQSFDAKDLEELQANQVHWSDIEAINRYGQTRDLQFTKQNKKPSNKTAND